MKARDIRKKVVNIASSAWIAWYVKNHRPDITWQVALASSQLISEVSNWMIDQFDEDLEDHGEEISKAYQEGYKAGRLNQRYLDQMKKDAGESLLTKAKANPFGNSILNASLNKHLQIKQ